MALRIVCPKCSNAISAPDSMKDREIRCPGCNIKLKIASKPSTPRPAQTMSTNRDPLPSESMLSDRSLLDGKLDAQTSRDTEVDSGSSSSSQPSVPAPPASKKRKRFESHHEEEDVEWDITPMVDVAFLLLIFFMLTAAFSIQKAIPSSAAPSEEASKSASVQKTQDAARILIIQIDEFNGFTVLDMDGQTNLASSKQELVSILLDLKEEIGTENIKVLIQAHVESLHGAAVTCMDAARQSGFGSFQLRSVEQF